MKIIYVTQYFPPETGAGAQRAYELATAWSQAGHAVTVVCPFPNYPAGRIDDAYRGRLTARERAGDVDVKRVPIFASPKKGFLSRVGSYASFAVSGALGALLEEKADVVYISSPPLPVGLAAISGRLRGAKLFFEVRDLWPESARVLGELHDGPVYRLAEGFEHWCYRGADRVVAVTEGIRSGLLARGVPAGKILFAPNGADMSRFDPAVCRPILPARERFEFFYGGLLGLAQAIPSFIETLRLLRDEPHIRTTIAGAGAFSEQLADAVRDDRLENVRLLGNVPAARIPALIADADACLVPLAADELFRGAVPSKLFEAWACGRPVVLSAIGEAARLVTREKAGVVVSPEDPGSLAEAVRWLAKNRLSLVEMGANARAAAPRFDRRRIAGELLRTMEAA